MEFAGLALSAIQAVQGPHEGKSVGVADDFFSLRGLCQLALALVLIRQVPSLRPDAAVVANVVVGEVIVAVVAVTVVPVAIAVVVVVIVGGEAAVGDAVVGGVIAGGGDDALVVAVEVLPLPCCFGSPKLQVRVQS